MKTVDKMPKYMDFEKALNCAIQKWKFQIQRKIDDTSDKEAGVAMLKNPDLPFFQKMIRATLMAGIKL